MPAAKKSPPVEEVIDGEVVIPAPDEYVPVAEPAEPPVPQEPQVPMWDHSEHVNHAVAWYGQPAWMVEYMLTTQDEKLLTKEGVVALIHQYLTTEVKG